jgi:hypothetical protein
VGRKSSATGEKEQKRGSKGNWNERSKRIKTEPVFLKIYGAQESIPRNQFRQPT